MPAFAQRVITTIAGTDWLFPGDGRPAVNAPLSGRAGLDLAVDRNGNYYIADLGNIMVMRVGPDNIINVIAGNGVNFVSGDGGLAVNGALFQPTAVAVDSGGTVYIAGYGGDIRKVTPDGIITTIGGKGNGGFGGDNGPAISASLFGPLGIAVDSGGNIFIADTNNNRVRKITPDGIITTVAGNGQNGSAGDGGPATSAQLNGPTRIAVDNAGNLYITEPGNLRIRKVDARGIITTAVGGGTDFGDGEPATNAALIPLAVTVDSSGNLYVVDGFASGIRKVDAQGRISTIAGGNQKSGFSGDGGRALNARFYFQLYPAIAVDPAGNIFVADEVNQRVRKITPDGIINTVAGNGLFHFSGNGGLATSATLDMPTGVIGDNTGNIYVTEPALSRIRRVTPDGKIDVYAGNGSQGYSGDNGPATSAALSFPMYISSDAGGNLYFTDSINCAIRKIDRNGIISTFAGTGDVGFSGDGGSPTQATFRAPSGLDFDSVGELIIADTQNNRLRVVFPAGPSSTAACRTATACILTLAGDGTAGFSGDGGISPRAEVNGPVGVRVFNGGIYFADSGNHRIRRIDISTLVITTVAGNGKKDYTGDGGPATNAALNNPQSINFDSAGNMYIADTNNSVIRRVTPAGIISTFAGVRTSAILGDGGLASAAGLGAPADIFFNSAGDLIFTDFFFNRVRAVLTSLPSFQLNSTNLAFTAAAGSTPVSLGVNVVGSITGIPFTASASSTGGWLQVSPANSAMPATVNVTADPSKLSAGSYQGTVTITAPNASPSTRTVAVALTVTAAGQPSLNVKPTSMTFSFVQQSPARARPLSISNAGGGTLAYNVATATTSGGRWLTVSAASGTAGPFASTSVNITANPAGLGVGTYSGTVTITSASAVIVPVTMTITSVQQTILIPQTGLTFFAVQGGGSPPPQFFSILNTGRGQMTFSTSASTISGGQWLSVFPNNGVSDADSPIVPQVRVDISPAGLAAGIYYGSVQVSAPAADNNPQSVSIILSVLPPGSNIGPIVQPTGLVFAAVAGAEPPGSQTVLVQNTTNNPVTFRSGQVITAGRNLFTSLPPEATVTQNQPVRVVIQPRTSGLSPGIYRGMLTLSFSDGNTRNVALVLVLLAQGSSLPSSAGSVAAAQASCQPTTLAPVFTLLSDGFTIPAGFPGQVTVKVIDDCANPQTSGGVTTTFSNGDPAIRLISLKDGTWAGTWTPQRSTPQITVTASAEIPEQNLRGQVQIKGGFQTFDQPPVIGGIGSAATGAQALLAPGSYMSIVGSKLAQSQASASSVPFPINLGGSTVAFAGQTVPLSFTSDGQVNALVPYGIAMNTTHQVVVFRGNSLSVPQSVTVAPAAPAIFAFPSLQGIITDIIGNIVDATHPVKAGDAIVIYCTGLGEVNPPVMAGNPASLTQLSNTVNAVSVGIGGVSVTPLFSGLTPGFVGLYQVNAVVPNGVAAGNQVPVTLTVAGQTSPPVTIAVR